MSFLSYHRNIQIRIIIQFFTTIATSMVLPFLAIYFANRIGQTVTGFMLIGIVIAAVAGGFIGGFLSDSLGRKKVMIASELFIFLSYLFIAFSNSPWYDSAYTTFALFLVNMFFIGVFNPVVQAMVIDVSRSKERRSIFALMYWANNLAMAIGGVSGAFLFKAHRFELFLVISLVFLVSLIMTIFIIAETYFPDFKKKNASDKSEQSIFSSYSYVLKDKTFVMFVIAGLLLLSLEEQLTNYIGIRLENEFPIQEFFNIKIDGLKMVGFLKSENTIIVVLLTVAVGYLAKKLSEKSILFIGITIYSIGHVFLGFSNNMWVLFIAMFVLSVGELMYIPVKQAYLADIAPSNARSSYMAVNSLTFYLSMMIAALFVTLGSFTPSWLMSSIYLVMGAVSALLLYIQMPSLNERRKYNRTDSKVS